MMAMLGHGRWESLRTSIFGVFYIMTEQGGNEYTSDKRLAFLRCVVIYFTDAAQVLRAVMLREFGWSESAVSLVDKANIIESIIRAVPWPSIPLSHFFLVAAALAAISLINLGVSMWLIHSARTLVLWPLRVLRFLIMILVSFVGMFRHLKQQRI